MLESLEGLELPGAVSYTHLDVYKRQARIASRLRCAEGARRRGSVPAFASAAGCQKLGLLIIRSRIFRPAHRVGAAIRYKGAGSGPPDVVVSQQAGWFC